MFSPSSDTQAPRQLPGSACEECRRRKLRCDRQEPQCGNCTESDIECNFRISRPPRGPKKGHLKALRNQIAALDDRVERLQKRPAANKAYNNPSPVPAALDNFPEQLQKEPLANQACSSPSETVFMDNLMSNEVSLWPQPLPSTSLGTENRPYGLSSPGRSPMEKGGTPPNVYLSDLVKVDLDQLFFDRVYIFASMIHQRRYLSWSKQSTNSPARVCLQYAMWTMAASFSTQFRNIQDNLYRETRNMLEAFESDSDKTEMIFLEHIQAWILLAMFEFMHNNHQRGLMSAGRAFRLVQMLCLFEIDSPSYAMARQSCAPTDHVKPEESRRTFWVAYTMDRVVSFNYGLPLTLNELEICTRLPTPEAKFQSGEPALMGFLCEVMGGINQDSVPPFTECIILATICGRSVSHKQRMTVEGVYGASTQDSLDRHQWLNTILAARIQVLSLSCPSTSESVDPILIFANLLAQATVLYLYKIIEPVVLEKDENQGMMAQYEQQSLTAAEETSHLTKMLAQLNHFQVNPSPPVQRFFGLQPLTFGWQAHPFVPVCLFVCAEFFMKHRSVNRSYGLQLQETLEALRRLASFNNLARVYLHLLGLNDA